MRKEESMYSIHPYEPFAPPGATKLIVGTMPPRRFCVEPKELLAGDVDFYYGSRDNCFWRLIGEASGETFDFENTERATMQRKAYLERHGFGITDAVEKCIHEGGRSGDDSLKEIEPRDMRRLLAENPGINTLIYTGGLVRDLMNRFTADDRRHTAANGNKRERSVVIGGRAYRVILLYSPSPRALQGIPGGSETRREQYKEVFSV